MQAETLFRMLRVVRPVEQEAMVISPNAKSEWFHVDRVRSVFGNGRVPEPDHDTQDFILPMPCTDVIFLRRNLVILHRNGFNMLNLPEYVFTKIPCRPS